jgi:hypothetical protein
MTQVSSIPYFLGHMDKIILATKRIGNKSIAIKSIGCKQIGTKTYPWQKVSGSERTGGQNLSVAREIFHTFSRNNQSC